MARERINPNIARGLLGSLGTRGQFVAQMGRMVAPIAMEAMSAYLRRGSASPPVRPPAADPEVVEASVIPPEIEAGPQAPPPPPPSAPEPENRPEDTGPDRQRRVEKLREAQPWLTAADAEDVIRKALEEEAARHTASRREPPPQAIATPPRAPEPPSPPEPPARPDVSVSQADIPATRVEEPRPAPDIPTPPVSQAPPVPVEVPPQAAQPPKTDALDAAQTALDVAGVAVPGADAANAAISVGRAAAEPERAPQHLMNALLSVAGEVPILGDAVKLIGKTFTKGGAQAAKAAGKAGTAAAKAAPVGSSAPRAAAGGVPVAPPAAPGAPSTPGGPGAGPGPPGPPGPAGGGPAPPTPPGGGPGPPVPPAPPTPPGGGPGPPVPPAPPGGPGGGGGGGPTPPGAGGGIGDIISNLLGNQQFLDFLQGMVAGGLAGSAAGMVAGAGGALDRMLPRAPGLGELPHDIRRSVLGPEVTGVYGEARGIVDRNVQAASDVANPFTLPHEKIKIAMETTLANLIEIPGALKDWSEALVQSKRDLMAFNGAVALSVAEAEARRIGRGVASGARVGESTLGLQRALDDVKDDLQYYTDAAYKVTTDIAATCLRILHVLIKTGEFSSRALEIFSVQYRLLAAWFRKYMEDDEAMAPMGYELSNAILQWDQNPATRRPFRTKQHPQGGRGE